jgi:hypothetical protein
MKLAILVKEIAEQSSYLPWEKGLIMAWGHVLYLGYHDIPKSILKIVDEKTTKNKFEEYYYNAENDEDLQDWMTDEPPTMNKGFALFDKNRLSNMLSEIANKTKLKQPLTIYRYSDIDYDLGWNSYTTVETDQYDGNKKTYTLPIGYPVIFASGIADNNEVIVNLAYSNKWSLKK